MYDKRINSIRYYYGVKSYPFTGLEIPIRLQEVEVLRISRQSAHKLGKVVSHMHGLPLTLQDIPGTHFY